MEKSHKCDKWCEKQLSCIKLNTSYTYYNERVCACASAYVLNNARQNWKQTDFISWKKSENENHCFLSITYATNWINNWLKLNVLHMIYKSHLKMMFMAWIPWNDTRCSAKRLSRSAKFCRNECHKRWFINWNLNLSLLCALVRVPFVVWHDFSVCVCALVLWLVTAITNNHLNSFYQLEKKSDFVCVLLCSCVCHWTRSNRCSLAHNAQ